MNRLTVASVEWQMASVSKQVEYRYDIGGLVTNIVYPGSKTLHYAYDTDGRLCSINDWNNNTFTFTHDAAGRLTRLIYPSGVVGTNTYDAAHRLASWKYSKSGRTLTGRSITRDAAGIKTGESVTAGLFPNPTQPRRTSNTFDTADRITSAVICSGTNTFNESCQYNDNGALTNCVSSQASEICSQSVYTYDHTHRFTSATLTNFLSQTLTDLSVSYDALGNRMRTVQNGTTRLWVTDHADPLKRPLIETDSSGNAIRYYIWGGGRLLAIIESDGTIHYTHSDELGSVVALTDSSGAITDQFSYGPYGENWGRSGSTDISFLWLGSHGVYNLHGTPLHLTRHRAYDTSTTRFLSSDPLGLGGGPNLYGYCLGNPLTYIDPLGLAVVYLYDGSEADNGAVRELTANSLSSYSYDMGSDMSLQGAINYMSLIVEAGETIDRVVIMDHGNSITGQEYNNDQLLFLPEAKDQDYRDFGALISGDGYLELWGCYVGENLGLVQDYANELGKTVVATTGATTYLTLGDVLIGVYQPPFSLVSRNPEMAVENITLNEIVERIRENREGKYESRKGK